MALIDNLVAYWPLDEASGNAIDLHDDNDLTETSGTIATGTGLVYATARDIEAGDTEYFTLADNTDLSMGDIDCTFAAWVYLESTGANRTILAKGTGGSTEYELYYFNALDGFSFEVFGSSGFGNGGFIEATTFGSPSTGTWYFVAARHDSVNNKIFIRVNDGADNEAAHTAGIYNGTGAFFIGNDAFNNYMDGLLGPVMIWKRVLTDEELEELYNGGAGLAYPFSGTAYTMAADNGAFTLSGTAAGLRCARKITAGSGTFALTGSAAALLAARKIAAGNGSFILTGQSATLKAARLILAGNGTFTLTGTSVALRAARVLPAVSGTFTLEGQTVTLTYSAAAPADYEGVVWMSGYFEP